MEIFEIRSKRIGRNAHGDDVETHIVGPNGIWTIQEAANLVLQGKAKFVYQGAPFGLDMLPVSDSE